MTRGFGTDSRITDANERVSRQEKQERQCRTSLAHYHNFLFIFYVQFFFITNDRLRKSSLEKKKIAPAGA